MTDWKSLPTDWNLALMYSGLDDSRIEQDIQAYTVAFKSFAEKWSSDRSYLTDASKLKLALDDFEQLNANFGELTPTYFVYLASKLAEDNTEFKGKLEKYADIEREALDQIRFFELSIAKIPLELQADLVVSPQLQAYKHYLARSFANAKYMLSEAEERIITELAGPIGAWDEMRNTLLSAEVIEFSHPTKGVQKLSYGEVLDLTYDTDKTTRDLAAVKIHKFTTKFAPIMEHELNALLQAKKAKDKLRGFEFPSQARHVADDMETVVVQALQTAVTNNFDIAAQFYKLKAKLLNQEKLSYHERNVPIKLNTTKQEYAYPEAIEMVYQTFNDLDPELGEIVMDFATDGRIDVFPKLNRHSGAFCIHGSKNQPFFVLLNHQNTLRDVTTIAHELGHAANNVFMAKAQNALNFASPLSTAEVASTFMEDFVLERLLANVTPEIEFEILMAKLNDEISTVSRQIACYNFEEELHLTFRDKGYLSKEQIGALFTKHMSAYMGEFVTQDSGSENWWVYWGHIRSYFYNYSYASGLIISKALQAKVKADKTAISQVKQFLGAGSSDSPANIFNQIGIDITTPSFWDEGMNQIRANLTRAEQLAVELKLV